MGSRIYMLVKVFDKEEYADAFLQHGEMLCRTLGEFKRIEGDEVTIRIHSATRSHSRPPRSRM